MHQDDVINIDRIFMRPPAPQPPIYDVYLSGTLDEAHYYQRELHLIRTLEEGEEVHLHLNGPGGYTSTAVQFIKAIRETKGLVVCYAEGECNSAYTFIFLAGHGFDVAEHNQFLCHNYSGGIGGKGNEIMKQAEMMKSWSRELIQDYYRGFLDQEEMDKLLDDRDIWLTKDEVLERCQKMVDMHEAEHKAEIEEQKLKELDKPTEEDLLKDMTPETAHADLVQQNEPAALYSRVIDNISVCFIGSEKQFKAFCYEGTYILETKQGHVLEWSGFGWEMEGFDSKLWAFKSFLKGLNFIFADDISEDSASRLLLDVVHERLGEESKKTP